MYEQRKGGGEFKHSAEAPNVSKESSGRKLDEGQVLENLDRHTTEIRKV